MTPDEIREQALDVADELAVRHALEAVWDELARQDARWGRQDHRAVQDGEEGARALSWYAWQATQFKATNDYREAAGHPSWDLVLLEEVYEALAETDPERYEGELIQVAAVAVQMWRASRRKRGADQREDIEQQLAELHDAVYGAEERIDAVGTAREALPPELEDLYYADSDPADPWVGVETIRDEVQ